MKAKDVIALLIEDHKRVRGLLEELSESTERGVKRRQTLLQTIAQELRIHTTVEEEMVYPALKRIADEQDDDERVLYYEAKEEHHVVDLLLPELEALDPGTPEFSAKACVLEELVGHHADEEEDEMFPLMKKRIEHDELVALGEQVEARKAELKRDGAPRAKRQKRRGESYAQN
jgi:hemerythrin superfamily protein